MGPRVFISYSHDSDEHKQRVRELVTCLRIAGVDARLDQYEVPAPPDGWPQWSARQIVQSHFTFVVCTENYCRRFEGLEETGKGLGVHWESRIIQNVLFYESGKKSIGFIPLLFGSEDSKLVPTALRGQTMVVLPEQGLNTATPEFVQILSMIDHQGGEALPIPPTLQAFDLKPDADYDGPILNHDIWSQITSDLTEIKEGVDRILSKDDPELRLAPPSEKQQDGAGIGIRDLHFSERWLEYEPRPACEAALQRFVDDSRPFLWWGVVGDGGMGKSRLAYEWALKLQKQGWYAGFLSGKRAAEWLSHHASGWQPKQSTFIVIDYASQSVGSLVDGLSRLRNNLTGEDVGQDVNAPSVRILLLDRPGTNTAIFSETSTQQIDDARQEISALKEWLYRDPDLNRQVEEETDKLRSGQETTGTISLPLVEDTELLHLSTWAREDWRNILSRVLSSSGGDPRQLPALTDGDWWDRVARLTAQGRPLYLQILGLCLSRNPEFIQSLGQDAYQETLLDKMIDHELEKRWPLLHSDLNLQGQSPLEVPLYQGLLRGLLLITMARGLELPAHSESLLQACGNEISGEQLQRLLPLLLHVQEQQEPGQSQTMHLPSLEPDLLGERLIIRFCSSGTDAWGLTDHRLLAPESLWRLSRQVSLSGTLETLTLLAQDFPTQPLTQLLFSLELESLSPTEPSLSAAEMNRSQVTGVAVAFSNLISGTTIFPHEIAKSVLTLTQQEISIWGIFFIELFGNEKMLQPDKKIATFLMKLAISGRKFKRRLTDNLVALGASTAINRNGMHTDWEQLERWGKLLQQQAKQFPAETKIQLQLTKGAYYAVSHYGTHAKWEQLELWGAILQQQADQFPLEIEFQMLLAKGAVNAIFHHGKNADWEQLERWGGLLLQQAERFPTENKIQLELAKGVVNPIIHYGTHMKWKQLERWGVILKQLAEQYSADTEIQLRLTQAAVNAISGYGVHGEWDRLERWGEVLQNQEGRFQGDTEFHLALAQGAVNAICNYGAHAKWKQLERWGAILQQLAGRFPTDSKVQLQLAQGAVNAISGYGTHENWGQLECWGAVLHQQAGRFQADSQIQLQLAQGAVNAMRDYGAQARWKQLERWGAILQQLAGRFPTDSKVQLQLAQGAVNAINSYATHAEWEQLERWGEVLQHQAGRFPTEANIQLELVKGAFNAVYGYNWHANCEKLESWVIALRRGITLIEVDHTDFLKIMSHALSINLEHQFSILAERNYLWTLVEYWPGYLLELKEQSMPLIMIAGQFEQADWQALIRPAQESLEEFKSIMTVIADSKNPLPEQLQQLRALRRFLPDRGAELFGPGKGPP